MLRSCGFFLLVVGGGGEAGGACFVGAFHLPDEHAFVGDVDAQVAADELGQVGRGLGGGEGGLGRGGCCFGRHCGRGFAAVGAWA